MKAFPNLGIGIGLRPFHMEAILTQLPSIDWFEIISENFLAKEGKALEHLDRIVEHYPVVQHGVNLSIGSPDSLDWDYLTQLKALTRRTKTPWLSDHLCWGRLPGAHFHDLLPLPCTKEVVNYVAKRAHIVQDFLEIPFALENLSVYATFCEDEMSQWEFYQAVVEKANIYMMLDINNIYVSSRNCGFNAHDFLSQIPAERVIQIHLAGHTDLGTYVLDTHDQPVRDEVWQLYSEFYPKTRGVSTLLEWDDHFMSLEETWKEALRAKEFQRALIAGMHG